MGAPWNLSDARLVQERFVQSAANATSVGFTSAPVPDGKVWVIVAFSYYPSAAETKVVAIHKVSKTGTSFGLLNPISLALNPAVATYTEQGMEHFLMPGEYLVVDRDSATAGSSMTAVIQFVEIDLPLYTYDDPQTVKRQDRALSSIRQRLGGGRVSVTRPPSDLGGERGGRSGPLPK